MGERHPLSSSADSARTFTLMLGVAECPILRSPVPGMGLGLRARSSRGGAGASRAGAGGGTCSTMVTTVSVAPRTPTRGAVGMSMPWWCISQMLCPDVPTIKADIVRCRGTYKSRTDCAQVTVACTTAHLDVSTTRTTATGGTSAGGTPMARFRVAAVWTSC